MQSPLPPTSQAVFDAHTYLQVIRRFALHLDAYESLLNDLNVFPVPDGDTGTNSLLTMSKCSEVAVEQGCDLPEVAIEVAKVASNQARGNSGVILSEYLRGLAQALVVDVTPATWRQALTSAAEVARQSVSNPRHGTILTVADKAAAVEFEGLRDDEYFAQVAHIARDAVRATTYQLPELEAAGVVDAGALALSLFHDAVVEQVTGQGMPAIELDVRTCALDRIEYAGPAYEVMYRFEGAASQLAALRTALTGIGDSVTVSGQQAPYLVHVHVDDTDAAVHAGMLLGRVHRITVTRLLPESPGAVELGLSQMITLPEHQAAVGVVVVCQGAGLSQTLRNLGAQTVEAPPRGEPATWQIRDAILQTGATQVVVLPSDANCFGSAQLAARDTLELGIDARVVPTTSVVQSLAACSVMQSEASLDEAVAVMSDVVSQVRHGSVTLADRDAQTPVGLCVRGDVLGLIDSQVAYVEAGIGPEAMLLRVIDSLVTESTERITVVEGLGVTGNYQEAARASHPTCELEVIQGGQLLWPYLVGVE